MTLDEENDNDRFLRLGSSSYPQHLQADQHSPNDFEQWDRHHPHHQDGSLYRPPLNQRLSASASISSRLSRRANSLAQRQSLEAAAVADTLTAPSIVDSRPTTPAGSVVYRPSASLIARPASEYAYFPPTPDFQPPAPGTSNPYFQANPFAPNTISRGAAPSFNYVKQQHATTQSELVSAIQNGYSRREFAGRISRSPSSGMTAPSMRSVAVQSSYKPTDAVPPMQHKSYFPATAAISSRHDRSNPSPIATLDPTAVQKSMSPPWNASPLVRGIDPLMSAHSPTLSGLSYNPPTLVGEEATSKAAAMLHHRSISEAAGVPTYVNDPQLVGSAQV